MWDWSWIQQEDSSDDPTNASSEDSSNESEESSADLKSDNEDDASSIPAITHTVVFKCIGNTKEIRYQEVLALANKKRKEGMDVLVKLEREPSNPVDARAIAIMCKVNQTWERIGYIVKEALDEVHAAIAENKILNVQFDWIKYVVHFKKPGWYAGIMITKNGEWSQTVLRSRANSFV